MSESVESRPGFELFNRSREDLLRNYMELQRQRLAAPVIDERLMALADRILEQSDTAAVMSGKAQLDADDRREFRASVRGLMGGGALVPLLERPDVENIHVLGHDTVILSLADGRRIMAPPLAESEEELVMMIRHLAATAGHTSRRFDTASPILDLRLASGHRLFAVTAVAERTSMVIRRHRMLTASLDLLLEAGTVTPQMIPVLRAAIRPPDPINMLVVGGTGAGKTTLLRSLLSEVPQSDLIVTVEDTLELHLRSSGLHVRTLALETRTANTEGTGEIAMYDLLRAALRMSPDRVIVGEVRGGEVMQLLQSMGIGVDGSLGTIHAGSTEAAINKILIYAQRSPDAPTPDSVLREIAEVLHLLVFIKKLPDGRRAITSIREVTGYSDGEVLTNEVFSPGPDGTGVYSQPFKPDGEALSRLRASGFEPSMLGPVAPAQPGAGQPPQQPRPARPPAQAPPRYPSVPPQAPAAEYPQPQPQRGYRQQPAPPPQRRPETPSPRRRAAPPSRTSAPAPNPAPAQRPAPAPNPAPAQRPAMTASAGQEAPPPIPRRSSGGSEPVLRFPVQGS
ncbi:CpaF family protein [Candidatus Poriferisodalis sp.]|uniref:CpaF family protein n=1 Tax=Candidatus Poriferisodalis sp. TaxID=3101277 RepID=UPI003B52768F